VNPGVEHPQWRLSSVLPSEEIRLLHRHGDDWREMRPAHHAPANHDIERQLLKGGRIFECAGCAAKLRVELATDSDE
jgi:hypothetical protein